MGKLAVILLALVPVGVGVRVAFADCFAGCTASFPSAPIVLTNPGGGTMTVSFGGGPGLCWCGVSGHEICATLLSCDPKATFSFSNDPSWGQNGWIPTVTMAEDAGAEQPLPVCAQPAPGSDQPPTHEEVVKHCGGKKVITIKEWRKRNDATQTVDINPDIQFTLECTQCLGDC